MSTKAPESWASDAQVHALRVEASPESTLLLPFDQFVYAEFHPAGTEQRLDLVFATHEVRIHGHCLRRLVAAVQRRELALISPVPEAFRSAISDGQPVVRRIDVTKTENPKSPETPNPE